MEKEKKYPIGAEHYTLYEEVGTGASASVYRALCNPLNDIVAVKILDFERNNCDLNNISREAQTMILVDHPNVLKSHCSFVSDHNLWVVMPYMSGGSCLHILKAAHPDGFEEVVIATILREVLKGLDYLHQHGHIHRDVKAGNILIDSRGAIKLGDFGVSACLFDSGDRQRMRNTFVGTPCWMAPEVMEQLHGYDFKYDDLYLDYYSSYHISTHFLISFKQMIASCLVKDPSKRPSAKKLLRHSFFKKARSNDYFARTLLEGLPALGDRLQALKNEYKRGISGWNFDLEDMKAQASLIQDDDSIAEKDEDMPDKQLQHQPSISRQVSQLLHQSSFASRYSDTADSSPSIIRYLEPQTGDVFTARFADCHFDENTFPMLGGEKKHIEKEITWYVPSLLYLDPRNKQCDEEVQQIVHLQRIANQMPDAFVDTKGVTKSHIHAINAPARIEIPKKQIENKDVHDVITRLKRGRPIGSKDKNPRKRKSIEKHDDHKIVNDVPTETHDDAHDDENVLLKPQNDENHEISSIILILGEIWNRNDMKDIDDIFSYNVAFDIINENEDHEPKSFGE
ncbi:serine/threonine-protein kinase fray2 [Dorcoceras hygrometricum]|uniref:Serine/threonine-protein kinase fray2 n=1 Tax=Dorcoceras hygrometricum TaxID=472368 RepID=A0A2Z7AHX9_9LAMI|nr:serine/threonine-protein kinase fray2 [Dorcoceras hygrometricum]